MCGITGFYDFYGKSSENILIEMTKSLHHRGPNNCNHQYRNINGTCVGIGHTRLSIIDISTGANQPMEFDNLSITFNGEIYNAKQIRTILTKLKYVFFTNSDTEVLLKAFHKWGKDCVNQLHGMWAFAIFDKRNKMIHICRDRLGVKPLYWTKQSKFFAFGSELKSLMAHPNYQREINISSVKHFFQHGYIKTPHCIFKNTYKLSPGTFISINQNGEVSEYQYWNTVDNYKRQKLIPNEYSDQQLTFELEEILLKSFRMRMVSDKPIGIFLSGGLDSSLLSALIQTNTVKKCQSYTIGFEDHNYNEANWAKKISKHLGMNHHELYCSLRDVVDILPTIPIVYDEPFADSSLIPTILLSQFASKDVSVALSADGADELFGGYPWYSSFPNALRISNQYNKIINSALVSKVVDFIEKSKEHHILNNNTNAYYKLSYIINKTQRAKSICTSTSVTNKYLGYRSLNYTKSILSDEINNSDSEIAIDNNREDLELVTTMQLIDLATNLQDDILVKVDRASMASSLETREPFLDQTIINFSSKLNSNKTHLKYNKLILKRILEKYLPRDLVYRQKKGFNIPKKLLQDNSVTTFYKDVLTINNIDKHSFMNSKTIIKLLDNYQLNNYYNQEELWRAFVFQQWCDKYL